MATMATSEGCLLKAGANVSDVFSADGTSGRTADTLWNELIEQAESYINVVTRYNWTDVYTAGLNVDVQKILQDLTTNLAAIYAIQYDMSNYASREYAETMIDVLWDRSLYIISLLRDKKPQDFMKNA